MIIRLTDEEWAAMKADVDRMSNPLDMVTGRALLGKIRLLNNYLMDAQAEVDRLRKENARLHRHMDDLAGDGPVG